MKIYDCFMYFDEDVVLDVRLNVLNKYVDKFVIIESIFNHKGEKRKPLFDINKFQSFKHKINYILLETQPDNLEEIHKNDDKNEIYRKSIFNAWKRENFQRNKIQSGLKDANDSDWIIISDLDEIPNLENLDFKETKDKFVFFKQHQIYYKFNLKLENYDWIGSKSCRYKDLESPQWIRDIKSKEFGWWRIDTFFSKKKYMKIKFIENGGWHFSYLKNPKDIETKLKSYLHHIDYDQNPLGENKIANLIQEKRTVYNLKADQRVSKFDSQNDLKKIDMNLLPKYINDNQTLLKEWLD